MEKDDVIQILSIEFDKDLENQSGDWYKGCQVDYKNSDGDVKQKNMHNNTFQFNKKLKTQLEAVKPGDYIKVSTERKGSFVNWKSVEVIEKPAEKKEKVKEEPVVESKGSYKSTYETPEERALRQKYIIRQSSISNAVAYVAATRVAGSDYVPGVDEVIGIAKEFEAYVSSTDEEEVKLPE